MYENGQAYPEHSKHPFMHSASSLYDMGHTSALTLVHEGHVQHGIDIIQGYFRYCIIFSQQCKYMLLKTILHALKLSAETVDPKS